jgi:cytochrome P450
MVQPLIGRWKLGKWLLAPSWNDVKATAAWVSNASKARVARVEDKARPDMFGAFLNAKHPKTGQTFDRKHLFAESMLFMGAGKSLLTSHLTYHPLKPS